MFYKNSKLNHSSSLKQCYWGQWTTFRQISLPPKAVLRDVISALIMFSDLPHSEYRKTAALGYNILDRAICPIKEIATAHQEGTIYLIGV